MTNETEGQTAYEAFKEWWGTAHRRARGRFNAFEAGVQFAEGRVSESRPSTVSGTTDYLRSVVEQVHRDTHDALEATPVEASRTPVETARRDDCVRCGASWFEVSVYHLPFGAQYWCIPQDDDDVPHVFVEPVPPSPEAVEPPLTAGWRLSDEEIAALGLERPVETVTGESTADERCETCGGKGKVYEDEGAYLLMSPSPCPDCKPVEKPVSPPLQEGGGRRPSWDRPESFNRVGTYWTLDGRLFVDWAHAGGERYHFPEALERAVERRLQTLLDEAQEERDRYRTALEEAESYDEYAIFNGAGRQVSGVGTLAHMRTIQADPFAQPRDHIRQRTVRTVRSEWAALEPRRATQDDREEGR